MITLVESRQIDVEQMDLVVTGDPLATVVEDQTGRADPVGRLGLQRDGSADHPDAQLPGQTRQEGLQRPVAVGLTDLELITVLLAHEGEVLGQDHQFGPLLHALPDQTFHLEQVGADIGASRHLDGGNLMFFFHCDDFQFRPDSGADVCLCRGQRAIAAVSRKNRCADVL